MTIAGLCPRCSLPLEHDTIPGHRGTQPRHIGWCNRCNLAVLTTTQDTTGPRPPLHIVHQDPHQ